MSYGNRYGNPYTGLGETPWARAERLIQEAEQIRLQPLGPTSVYRPRPGEASFAQTVLATNMPAEVLIPHGVGPAPTVNLGLEYLPGGVSPLVLAAGVLLAIVLLSRR